MGAIYLLLISFLGCSMSWVFIKDIYPSLRDGKSLSPMTASDSSKK
jgi:hypothetical protein